MNDTTTRYPEPEATFVHHPALACEGSVTPLCLMVTGEGFVWTFADANYALAEELTEAEYGDFEEHVLARLAAGHADGTHSAGGREIEWRLTNYASG